MNIQSYLDTLTAKLQGEVGRFLILKERILSLPSSDRRNALLSRQNSLESRAMKLAADASALKEAASYKGTQLLNLFSGEKISQASNLVNSGSRLISEMNSHTQDVNLVTGTLNPATPSSRQSAVAGIAKQVVMIGVAAFVVNWAWRGARGFAKGRGA